MAEEAEQGKNVPKEKQSKELTKMWKEMQKATGSAGTLGGIFSLMEMLEPLLKPLEIILEIVGMLFMTMAAEILPYLVEAIEPLMEFLMSLQPLFAEIGQIIGQLVAEFLPPFIKLLVDFLKALLPLMLKIMDLIKILLQLAIKILPIVIKIFTHIANVVLAVLKPILDWLGSLSPSELGAVIYVFGLGLSALYGLLHGGPWIAALYAGLWAAFMSPLLAFQEGGIATRPMMGLVAEAEPEAIIPISRLAGMFDELAREQENTNELLEAIYEDKRFRHTLSGGW